MALFCKLPALPYACMESQKQGQHTTLAFHDSEKLSQGAKQQIPPQGQNRASVAQYKKEEFAEGAEGVDRFTKWTHRWESAELSAHVSSP